MQIFSIVPQELYTLVGGLDQEEVAAAFIFLFSYL